MNQEITNLLKAYEKALNTSDTNAAMALYGSEPVFEMDDDLAYARTTSAGQQEVLAGHTKSKGSEQRTLHLSQGGRCVENSSLPLCYQQPARRAVIC